MIKRTLFFEQPSYLSTKHHQLVVSYPESDEQKTIPIEDIGLIVLEHQQITITNGLLHRLAENNVALIHCDGQHLPIGLMLPIVGHSEQSERYKFQINASLPLKKNLWQQTVIAKITNQAMHLAERGQDHKALLTLAETVQSGDSKNNEAQAAAIYWRSLFPIEGFTRDPDGETPNNLLNYGYAILRGIAARALVGSGLLPTLGIFHKNKYNAYCLADDIMEPYRPFVDMVVWDIVTSEEDTEILTSRIKKQLLCIPTLDVTIGNVQRPLQIALSRTTSSLVECFAGSARKINYPLYEH